MEDIKDEVIVDEVKDIIVEDNPVDEIVEDATSYTDAQLEDLMKPLKDEVDRLNKLITDDTVPKEEIEYQNRMKELWNKEVTIELKMEGLSDFAEFFVVEENNREVLEQKIKSFKEVLGKRELDSGYVPDNHRNTDKYSLAEKSKDTKAMIGSKLSSLFK